MADEKILTNAQEDESSTLVKFSKAYRFEGKDYTEVDLSGMDDARIRLFHCRPCSEAAHRVLQGSAAQGCPQG